MGNNTIMVDGQQYYLHAIDDDPNTPEEEDYILMYSSSTVENGKYLMALGSVVPAYTTKVRLKLPNQLTLKGYKKVTTDEGTTYKEDIGLTLEFTFEDSNAMSSIAIYDIKGTYAENFGRMGFFVQPLQKSLTDAEVATNELNSYASALTFYPIIHLKSHSKLRKPIDGLRGWVTDYPSSDEYLAAKEFLNAIGGIRVGTLVDGLRSSENASNISEAVLILGANIKTDDPVVKNYCFEFVEKLYNSTYLKTLGYEDIQQGTVSVEGMKLHTLRINSKHYNLNYSFNKIDYYVTTDADVDLHTKDLRTGNVAIRVVSGEDSGDIYFYKRVSLKNAVVYKMDDVVLYHEALVDYKNSTVSVILNDSGMLSEDPSRVIQIVELSLADTLSDNAFFFPLDKKLVDSYVDVVDRGNFLEKCLLLSTIVTTSQKLEWYQTSFFTKFVTASLTVLAVAGVIMAFVDLGFTAGLIAIATAALLSYIAVEFVMYVFKKTDNKYARAAAVILAVVAISAGANTGAVGLNINTLLAVTNAVTVVGMATVGALAAEDNRSFEQELLAREEYSDELEERLKEFEIDKSYLFMFNQIFAETPEEFEYRTQELDTTEMASDVGSLSYFGMAV
jgi:hypothetical protein